jgi:hypothetical protein
MGILAMATADLRDLSIFNSLTAFTISSDYARTGTYSFKSSIVTANMVLSFPLTVSGYARCCFYMLEEGDLISFVANSDVSAGHFRIFCSTSLLTLCTPAATDVASMGISANTNTWNILEIYWLIASSGGILQARLNGGQLLEWNNKDTYSSGLIGLSSLQLRKSGNNVGPIYIDDIIIRDDQWPGRGGIYVLKPNAGTTTEEWFPSSGNPEDCVKELPPSGDQYVYTDAAVSGPQQLFGIESLPIPNLEIKGIGVCGKIKASLPTDTYAANLLKSGPTVVAGSGLGIDVSPVWMNTYYHLDPNTGSGWTTAALDSLEVGVQSLGSGIL